MGPDRPGFNALLEHLGELRNRIDLEGRVARHSGRTHGDSPSGPAGRLDGSVSEADRKYRRGSA